MSELKDITWKDVLNFAKNGNPAPPKKVIKSEEEWKSELPADVFYVTRKKGTERAFSSELCGIFTPGEYSCVCCATPLFNAKEKFDSGTGWPSFTNPIKTEVVAYNLDMSHGMSRVETVCNVCDSHLGHVFPDGPSPSGLRFCINALSLNKTSK